MKNQNKSARCSRRLLLVMSCLLAAGSAPVALASSVSLSTSPNPSIFGSAVTLTATVSPASATGTVTFYDGATVLGAKPVSSGTASISTILLSSGTHSLTAFYGGDGASDGPARSPALTETVTPVSASILVSGVAPAVGSNPTTQAIGDFNGDGIVDLAVANSSDNNVSVLLGNGDGTFAAAVNYALGASPVAIVAGDFNGDGKSDLAVATGSAGSGAIIILLGNGNGTFTTAGSLPADANMQGLAAGDFNGDGKLDLVGIFGFAGSVALWIGNGDGTFNPQNGHVYPVGQNPTSIQVGDFNGDGLADVAVTNAGSNNVTILLGGGDGTFAHTLNSPAGSSPIALAIGDFNGDGIADLAVANSGPGVVTILLGNGDGTFTAEPNACQNINPVPCSVGSVPHSITVADFDGDGNLDVAVANSGSNNVSVLRGNGDGTFQPAANYPAGMTPLSLSVADFNGDGRADLAVANPSSGTTTILLGAGSSPTISASSGTPQTAPVASGFAMPLKASITDANEKPITGIPVTFTAPSSGPSAALSSTTVTTDKAGVATVTATANTMAGSYMVTASAPGVMGSPTAPPQFALTNGAGPAAMVMPSSGTPQQTPVGTPFTAPLQVTVTDTYGNSAAGVTVTFIAPNSGASAVLSRSTAMTNSMGIASITAMANGTIGTYNVTPSVVYATSKGSFSLANTKGTSSLLLTSQNNPSTFGSRVNLTITMSSTAATGIVTLYDGANIVGSRPLSNGTASISTILLSSGKHTLTAYYSGDSNYTSAKSLPLIQTVNPTPATTLYTGAAGITGTAPIAVAVADFNGDGIADLAVVNKNDNDVTILLGNGDGTFTTATTLPVGNAPVAIVAADFNSDGKIDLAVANSSSGTVSVLLGNGNGTFAAPAPYSLGPSPSSIAVGDFNGDGIADLAVTDSSKNQVTVLLGVGDGTFVLEGASFAVGLSPQSIQVSDFNGDGKPDLAVADGGDNSVGILLGNGDGTFAPMVSYGVDSQPQSLSVGDFNGDGNPDLAVANGGTGANSISVLLGNGDGTFKAATRYAAGGASPWSVVVADINGDGIPDLAVANLTGQNVTVLLGKGDGTFSSPTGYRVGSTPSYVAVGDFNGDGRADLAVANQGGTTVSILLGAGPAANATAAGGAAQSAQISTQFAAPLQVNVTDSNNNPVPGVTVSFAVPTSGASATLSSMTATTNNAGAASVVATANTSAGTYLVTASVPGVSVLPTFTLTNTNGPAAGIASVAGTPQATPISTPFPVALQAMVTDSGGNPVPGATVTFALPASGATASLSSTTAATNSFGVASVTATANGIAGTYSVTASVPGAANAATFALTNAKATPSLQLASSGNFSRFGSSVTLTATLGSPNATGTVTFYDGTTVLGANRVSAATASITTILLSSGTHSLSAYYSGDANFTPAQSTRLSQAVNPVAATGLISGTTLNLGNLPTSVAVGDFNGDGKADLAVANSGSGTVSVLLGNGDGTFAPAVNYSVGTSPISVAVGDFNGDGNLDLAVANDVASGNSVYILLGKGDGTFAPALGYAGGSGASFVAIGDFNGDGKADVAVADSLGNSIGILLGNGDGTFGPLASYPVGHFPFSIAIGDFNGDGKADLAVVNDSSDDTVSVLLGNGDGTFARAVTYAVGSSPISVVTADFNGDGKVDLAVANSSSNNVSVLLGNGDGTFAPAVNYPAALAPYSIIAADLNGDGKVDLAVTDSGNNTLTVLPGNGDGTFAAAVNYATGTDPVSLATGDFNGDGKADLAVANQQDNTVTILLGTGSAPSLVASAGGAQSAIVNAPFGTQLQATVTDSAGNPLANVSVTFIAPSSGASGTFAGGGATVTVPTNTSGVATAPVFTANNVPGSYVVTATALGIASAATFALTNTAAGVSITTTALPNGSLGAAYSGSLAVQGGMSPYAWSISSGSLPAGLSLNPTTGVISGTPTTVASSTFTVKVTDSSGQSATKVLSITVNPLISLVLPSGAQQPGSSVTTGQIQAAQPVSAPVSGMLSLNFNENAAELPTPYTNPGVCFSSTSCSTTPQTITSFTIPAGSTSTPIPAVQTGTVAGDIVLTLTASGQPTTQATLTVPRTAPIIEANSVQILDVTSSGFMVELVANSSPRDLQTATFTFNAAAGAQISGTTTFTADVSTLLSTWYSSAQGQSYGSSFSLQVPFTLSGNSSAIQSVTVTLTNSAGTSAPVTGTP